MRLVHVGRVQGEPVGMQTPQMMIAIHSDSAALTSQLVDLGIASDMHAARPQLIASGGA